MRKFFVGTAAILTVSLGALGIAALNPFGGAGAASHHAATTAPAKPAAPTPAGAVPFTAAPAAAAAIGRPGAVIEQVLADLVSKGTITQSQSDAIMAALKAKVASLGNGHPGTNPGGGRRGVGREGIVRRARRGALEIAAKTIGITPQQLAADLKGGQSIAQVATAKGVQPQTVINAIVAAGDQRIDKAVSNNKLTAAQAAKLKARLVTAATKAVNATRH